MDTMERDPAYIAQRVKGIRQMFRLTQENLAEAAGLTTRTIEKIESGRHRPDEQTLRSLARALKIDVAYFQKPTPEQEEAQKAAMERALHKIVLVHTSPIRTAADFMAAIGTRHAFRFDISKLEGDEALDIAAPLVDRIKDLAEAWDDCNTTDQLAFARACADECSQLENLGYICQIGSHKQVLRDRGQPDLVFIVGLLTVHKKTDGELARFAMIHLEGRWETVAEDRMPLGAHSIK
jgi:transcriptional regulator with XRE-family HTH domain